MRAAARSHGRSGTRPKRRLSHPSDRFGQHPMTGRRVALSDHPATCFARLMADAMDDRRPVVLNDKLTHMHGFMGKYTILAHLLDMSRQWFMSIL